MEQTVPVKAQMKGRWLGREGRDKGVRPRKGADAKYAACLSGEAWPLLDVCGPESFWFTGLGEQWIVVAERRLESLPYPYWEDGRSSWHD